MEQEVLRLDELHQAERGLGRLPGVHPLPHDPGQRPHEGDPPTRNRALPHHNERASIPGKIKVRYFSGLFYTFYAQVTQR